MNILDMKWIDFEPGLKFEVKGKGKKQWKVVGRKPQTKRKKAIILLKREDKSPRIKMSAEIGAEILPSMIERILS